MCKTIKNRRAYFKKIQITVFKNKSNQIMNICVNRLFDQSDASSLATFRILFGILMFFDAIVEREIDKLDTRWGEPSENCYFPLIHSLQPLSYRWMCIIYLIMWLGSIGIALGSFFHVSCLAYIIPYWYIIFLDKVRWNNHTYLYGLIAILLYCTKANACWSIDSIRKKTEVKTVPFWNYFLLRYQIFILYFMAGVKKINYDWLNGYCVRNLSQHWSFDPFKILLSNEQIDLWIIHIGGFLIDITAGFGLIMKKTRPFTFLILFCFNAMNSRLFTIGMFSYVCIGTMFIFCDEDWPKKLPILNRFLENYSDTSKMMSKDDRKNFNLKHTADKFKNYRIIILICLYVFVQLFLPFSHFITKGYNGWMNGLYGYSWNMMLIKWDISAIIVKVVNNENGETFYIDPDAWVPHDKWMVSANLLIQYAQCVRNKIQKKNETMRNISVYVDVWSSINERFHQRMYNPGTDLLTVKWSPFEQVTWIMPLLDELSDWRDKFRMIEKEVYTTSNTSNVIFVADFPGYTLENFVENSITNLSIMVLQGTVQIQFNKENIDAITLNPGDTIRIPSNQFHWVQTISKTPSGFMYTYQNNITNFEQPKNVKSSFIILVKKMMRAFYLINETLINIYDDLLSTLFTLL